MVKKKQFRKLPEPKLHLQEIRKTELKRGTSHERFLEMCLDEGDRSCQVTRQFFNDVAVYGIKEAYSYLLNYQKKGTWNGTLSEVTRTVDKILKQNNREGLHEDRRFHSSTK